MLDGRMRYADQQQLVPTSVIPLTVSAVRLSEFITQHREQVLAEWVKFARTCTPGAEHMDSKALRDHAAEMLDAIIADLNSPETESQRSDKALGKSDAALTRLGARTAAQSHGAGRASNGFDVGQMISEYRALRASVLRLWVDESKGLHSHETEDLMRFNEAIDQALAESTSSYARVVEQALREAQEELEARVAQRTRDLARANEALRAEMHERDRSEQIRIGLLQRLVGAQENEQRRISRELHDQLGQQVTALGLKLSGLQSSAEVNPHLQGDLAALGGIVRHLDQDIDFIVWQLRPTALDDLGLVEALKDYVVNWSSHFNVSAQLNATGMDELRLSADVETVLYRVTQEALNNVAKHAGAEHVEIVLTHARDETLLTIADDGVGFDVQRQRRDDSKGLGLQGMGERAALVGGTMKVEAQPGDGTTVSVRVPAVRS
jgi:signal transduction histidine kinase